MRFELKLAISAGAALLAAGCAPVDPGMGEALRYDMAAQTVDPDPVYPEDGAKPGDSGEHGAKASERYRKGTVKDVQSATTSSGTGGNSGGGSGPR
ncbi:hypothetical protein [Sphingomonas jaspsi]|uniref:hypothetical protein n=1 Tax=Sphingomonas jaspsi TaxID=392409 RepID=UPI0004B472AB|nr:hypothetical protein [Sphingomonas jaspsi]